MQNLYIFGILVMAVFLDMPIYGQENPIAALKKTIANMAVAKGMENASLGVCILNANTGEIVAQQDMNRSLVTASTMKLITTSSALALLGEDFRYKTILEYTGKIENGVLQGNLYIKGSGDPSLGSDRFGAANAMEAVFKKWSEALKQAGIYQINGKIIGDARVFSSQNVPDNWSWQDLGNYYGAGPMGLCINENMYEIHLRTGDKEGEPVSLLYWDKNVRKLEFINELTTGEPHSGDNSYIYGAPYTYLRYIRGTLPPNQDDFVIKGSIPDPESYCAEMFCDKLAELGIPTSEGFSGMAQESLKGNIHTDSRTVLYTHLSPTLKDIVYWTNLKSVNLFAECILSTIGLIKKGIGSTKAGLEVIESYWAERGLPTQGLFLTDGSGLSPNNAATAYQMALLLKKVQVDKSFPAFYRSLPIAGQTGTLASMCEGTIAEGNVFAKSGYMTRVRSYAGYVSTKSGKKLCFAVFANNYNDKAKDMKARLEELMIKMAEL